MIKIFILMTGIFMFSLVQAAEDTKYASSQEIESMQQQAVQSLTPLMEAIIEKDLPKITKLIEQEQQTINVQDNTGQTALMWAIIHQLSLDVIKLLLAIKDINLSITDNQGLTALDHAVMSGNEEIVEAILNSCKLKDGICPLVNQRDKKLQLTSLARAAIDDNSKIINLLLRAGADHTAMITREAKNIPVSELYKEYTNRGLEVVKALDDDKPDQARKLLVLGIDVNAIDENGSKSLHLAAEKGYNDIVKLLIDNKADVNAKDNKGGRVPLYWAAQNGHKDIVQLLINNKAEVNVSDKIGYTPLHEASFFGHKDTAQLLIDNKADVNAKSLMGYTPMHLAADKGYEDIVQLLINNKADVNAIDNFRRRTSLHWAASNGHIGTVNLLINNNADVNRKDNDGITPLHLANLYKHIEIIELLKKAGAH